MTFRCQVDFLVPCKAFHSLGRPRRSCKTENMVYFPSYRVQSTQWNISHPKANPRCTHSEYYGRMHASGTYSVERVASQSTRWTNIDTSTPQIIFHCVVLSLLCPFLGFHCYFVQPFCILPAVLCRCMKRDREGPDRRESGTCFLLRLFGPPMHV